MAELVGCQECGAESRPGRVCSDCGSSMEGARPFTEEERLAWASKNRKRPGVAIGQLLEVLGWGWISLSVLRVFYLLSTEASAALAIASFLQGILVGTLTIAIGRMSRSIAEMRYP